MGPNQVNEAFMSTTQSQRQDFDVVMSAPRGTNEVSQARVVFATDYSASNNVSVAKRDLLWPSSSDVRAEVPPPEPSHTSSNGEAQPGTPRWFNYIDRRLKEFEAYGERMTTQLDAYPKPTPEAVVKAWTLVLTHFRVDTPTPSVGPSVDRGVDFVWYKGGWHVEVAVGSKETTIWAHNRRNGELWYGPLSEKLQDFERFLEGLSGLE